MMVSQFNQIRETEQKLLLFWKPFHPRSIPRVSQLRSFSLDLHASPSGCHLIYNQSIIEEGPFIHQSSNQRGIQSTMESHEEKESFGSFPDSIASTNSDLSSDDDDDRPLCEIEEFCTPSWRSAATVSSDESGSSRTPSIGPRASAHTDVLGKELRELEEVRQEVLRKSWLVIGFYMTSKVQSWLRLVDDKVHLAKTLQERMNSSASVFSWWQNRGALKLGESITALRSAGMDLLDSVSNVFVGQSDAVGLVHRRIRRGAAFHVVGIRGPEGVGKTRILLELLEKEVMMFRYVIWLTAPHSMPTSRIQEIIAKQLGLSLPDHNGEEGRRTKLHAALSGLGFFLVLDDLRGAVDLEQVGIPRPAPGSASKIVITSRSEKVCRDMGADVVIDVPVLPEQEAWELFCNVVGDAALQDPGGEEMARELVRGCGGLPSVLVRLGRAVKDERSVDDWRHYHERPHLLRELGVMIAPDAAVPVHREAVVKNGLMVHAGGGRFYLREEIDPKWTEGF